ncbi:MAG: arylesterase [Chthoniobacterales bacterium]
MRKMMRQLSRVGLLLGALVGSTFAQPAPLAADTAESERLIVFLGDSLSAGLGVESSEAFPALIAQRIRAGHLPFQVENAGVSGDTTAGGLRRIDWLLQRKIDVLVIELGANDGFRGLTLTEMKKNLQAIITKARTKNSGVKIVLAGMQIPPNLGADYATKFRQVYVEIAKENNATLIPFLLDGVGGHADLNQSDMIHPTAEGHRVVAGVVWKTLEPILREIATR